MQVVAEYLKQHAIQLKDEDERDLFGRSAFNRYYYAAFLVARKGLRDMRLIRPEDKVSHADLPNKFRGGVRDKFVRAMQRAKRAELYSFAEKCGDAARAAKELGDMLESARGTRTTADYYPEHKIEVSLGGFSLMSVSVDAAKVWPQKAELYIAKILSVWGQVQ